MATSPSNPCAHRGHEILEARSQFRRLSYGHTQLGKDVPIQEVPSGTQRQTHHVPTAKDKHIENIVQDRRFG